MHIDIGACRAGRTRQVCQNKLELLFMFTTNRGEWVCTLNYEPGYLLGPTCGLLLGVMGHIFFTVKCYTARTFTV